jgi:hypothetical protein
MTDISMKRLKLFCAIGVLLLVGCAGSKNDRSERISAQSQPTLQQASTKPVDISPPDQQPAMRGGSGAMANIKECRNELDALGAYNRQSYISFQKEFTRLGQQTANYLKIKDQISPEINDLVMPRQVFQMRELCFRIKTRLSQLLIQQTAQ